MTESEANTGLSIQVEKLSDGEEEIELDAD